MLNFTQDWFKGIKASDIKALLKRGSAGVSIALDNGEVVEMSKEEMGALVKASEEGKDSA